MAISTERIREIEQATLGQAQNPLWHEYRKNRLTASQFGRALTAYASLRDYKSSKKLEEMRRGMVTSGSFTNPAIEWGTKHEATAVAEYVKHSGNKVIPSGIWLFPEGDLAASPDGIVVDANDPSKYLGLLEIKCPYKCSREQIRSGADWRKYLRYLDNSNRLLPTHDYYHQIQGQLCATNLEWCDFVVWCPTAFLVQRINLDPVWRSTTLFSLHSIYQWEILRPEDRTNRNLVWPSVGGEEVDLEKLFTHCAIEKDIREVFVYCLAVHLGRWINSMAHSTGNWEESCKREQDLAKKKFCCLCFLRYFLHRWKTENHYLPLPPLVAKIQSCKWTIPDGIWEDAKRQLINLTFSNSRIQPPCLCCKL